MANLQGVFVACVLFFMCHAARAMPVGVWPGAVHELPCHGDCLQEVDQTEPELRIKDIEPSGAVTVIGSVPFSSYEDYSLEYSLLDAVAFILDGDRSDIGGSPADHRETVPERSSRTYNVDDVASVPQASVPPEGVFTGMRKKAPSRRLSVSAALGTLSDLLTQAKLQRVVNETRRVHQRLMSVGR